MERSDVWFLVCTGAVVGFISGLAWSDLGHKTNWLFQYQTLVTGALAVIAAFFTVNAMNATEERQQARHDELMGFSRRSDRMIAERASALAGLFRGSAKDVSKLIDAFGEKFSDINDPKLPTRTEYNAAISILNRLNQCTDAPLIVDASRFFDAKTSISYYYIKNRSDTFLELIEILKSNRNKPTPNSPKAACKAISKALKELKIILPHLERLADSISTLKA
ncbi:MAG: hypothetical protein E5X48_28060 [Mesorhizobium sp.]|uniref:hypothetical protein n=1 Tax=Mesorhizobium sp. TaxID=1871066 RepID=UPI0012081A74|nr:hypothetical protein [Mesorhizobium sp.]TIQ31033.1 MAG: hypothetical protein E5X48_28060 [Mesorhizobium sp.]